MLVHSDADAHDLLGVALAMQGRLEEAVIHLTRAVEIDPGHTAAVDHLQRIDRARAR